MTNRAQDRLQQALELPELERVDLAAELLATLSKVGPTSTRSSEEWIAEVERRAKDALAGAPGVSWDCARAEIEARLRRRA